MEPFDAVVVAAAWIPLLIDPRLRNPRAVGVLVLLTLAFAAAGLLGGSIGSVVRIVLILTYFGVWFGGRRWLGADSTGEMAIDAQLRRAISAVSVAHGRWVKASDGDDLVAAQVARIETIHACDSAIKDLEPLQPPTTAWRMAVRSVRAYLGELRAYASQPETSPGTLSDPTASSAYLSTLNEQANQAWQRALKGGRFKG